MTDLNNVAPAPAPAPAAGASSPPPAPLSGFAASQAQRDQLRTALEQLTDTVAAIEATSAAVGNTTVSQVYMVLADLAVATTAVSDAAAAVEAAAAAFVVAPGPPAPPSSMFRTTGPWIAGSLYTVIPAEPLAAVPDNTDKWFAITSGKYVGLTKNAALSLAAVVGVSNALSTSFTSQTEALEHFNSALEGNAIAVIR
ncbi:hypothetical protein DFH06DRAFT_1319876 [Mycena polygramma]|nr:hypothetical protein DFH06DRAFT_1319876 [Mycena polygramma]